MIDNDDIKAMIRIHDMCKSKKECAGCVFVKKLFITGYSCRVWGTPEEWEIGKNESEEKIWMEDE